MTRTPSVFDDREVLDELANDPDLLAIADALVATRARRRLPVRRLAAVLAAVLVAGAVALLVPWPGRGSGFTARALAALGDGEVIHVVSVTTLPDQSTIDLATGAETPIDQQSEIWFDADRGLERVVTGRDGAVIDTYLQTPQGEWTQAGRVYTCAWIAAHPVQATAARVSCSADGVNGTKPKQIPEPRPALDPALAGFVSGYRDALASGAAVHDGDGTVDGKSVEWLRFTSTEGTERVAVDTQTLKPLLVDTTVDGQVQEVRIASIETEDAAGVDFSRPAQIPPGQVPTASSTQSEQMESTADANTALAGRLLTLGSAIDGLPLAKTTVQQIVTSYGAGAPDTHSTSVEQVYGSTGDPDYLTPHVRVDEATTPEALYGFGSPSAPVPAAGTIAATTFTVYGTQGGSTTPVGTDWRGRLAVDGVYVEIEATSESLLLGAARALAPVG